MTKIKCIYCIENIKTKIQYIGSSNNYKGRIANHFYRLRNNKHHSKYLQNSYNKHSELFFKYYIIEECDEEQLIEKEQYWIDLLKPKYNLCLIAGKRSGYKHTEEFKKKLSEKNKGINHWTYKKDNPYSDEARLKMSLTWKNKYLNGYINPTKNRIKSDKQIQSIKDKNSKIVYQYDKDMLFIRIWNSVKEASDDLKINFNSITNVANPKESMSKYKTAGGYIWKYKIRSSDQKEDVW